MAGGRKQASTRGPIRLDDDDDDGVDVGRALFGPPHRLPHAFSRAATRDWEGRRWAAVQRFATRSAGRQSQIGASFFFGAEVARHRRYPDLVLGQALVLAAVAHLEPGNQHVAPRLVRRE